ncbi:hypothetical protein K457DRAFT_130547 [Linnemannia elongata AG-77]|uniref:Uncharacterized protein n=1 Tax=Linnemannia elongata AG-77 TaxID=1314771 RepID=A0A197JEE0_9FUNG|nr:hypothetical protein K457DRAFT_130547 [Linnemannia elongata AG-77]
MLLNKIALTLAVASLVAADFIPRTAPGGCPDGYVQTKKICKIANKPDVCCPTTVKNPSRNDYRRCIPQLTGCSADKFACPESYGGNCCPNGSFCGTSGDNFGCFN